MSAKRNTVRYWVGITLLSLVCCVVGALGGLYLSGIYRFVSPVSTNQQASVLDILSMITTVPFPPRTWSNETPVLAAVEDPTRLDQSWAAIVASGSEEVLVARNELVLPTGEILATDLNFVEDNRPLRLKVPPGSFPVLSGALPRVGAFAAVLFAEDQPQRWAVAGAVGDAWVDRGGVQGLSLDSSGILVDAVVCDGVTSFNASKLYAQKTIQLDADSGLNIVRIDLGGVGVYPMYWGLSEAGEPLVLLITEPVFNDKSASTEPVEP